MPLQKHQYDYDMIVIGGGSAGIVAAVMASALGLRVLVCEKDKIGGVCSNTGCVPSKALLYAAKTAQTLRAAEEVGLKSAPVTREDAAGVLAHVRRIIRDASEADDSLGLMRDNGAEVRFTAARFEDTHTVILDDQSQVTAARFLLATGSRAAVPNIPGLRDLSYLTNETIFDLDAIPESLCVIGGGPVGVEMAQAFHRLGSRVTLLQEFERLLPRDDSELAGAIAEILRSEGIDIRLGAKAVQARREDGQAIITALQDGQSSEIKCERVLISSGRLPNVEGLQLHRAGVSHDAEKVIVDDRLRTTAKHIYAAGDLLGHDQYSHMAEYEAKAVIGNIVAPFAVAVPFRINPWATFTDPEVVHLGLTEDEARQKGIAYELARQPFAQNDRALTDNAPRGFIKVLTQGITGKILGVHIIGPRAGELMQEWIMAMQHGLTVRAVADMIHVYPTLSMVSQHVGQRWYEQQSRKPLAKLALRAYIHVIRPHAAKIGLGAAAAIAAGIGFSSAAASRKR